jgi:hypothetical protein
VALIVKTKSKIGAFLEEENVHYNRVGLNLRLVQERTLAGYASHLLIFVGDRPNSPDLVQCWIRFAGDMSLYVDLLQSANTYGSHPTSTSV